MRCLRCDKALVKKSKDGKWRVRVKGVLAFALSESGLVCETVCPHCGQDTAINLESEQLELIIRNHQARPVAFYVKPPTRNNEDG
jgi:hypothetical protein